MSYNALSIRSVQQKYGDKLVYILEQKATNPYHQLSTLHAALFPNEILMHSKISTLGKSYSII
jgi:hypothetical protein